MTCKSFYCKICDRRINVTEGSVNHSIRQHYWTHHRPVMMEGVKTRTKARTKKTKRTPERLRRTYRKLRKR